MATDSSSRPQKRPRTKTFNPRDGEGIPEEAPIPEFIPPPLLTLLSPPPQEPAVNTIPLDMPPDLYERMVLLVESDQTNEWPRRTNELCRWDMQPFEGTPVGLPVRYDDRRRKYCLQGYFCSFACARTWNRTDGPVNSRQLRDTWLCHLVQECYAKGGLRSGPIQINPAPPREKLSQLYASLVNEGGHEDPMKEALRRFRVYQQDFTLHVREGPFVRVTHLVEEKRTQRVRQEQQARKLELMRQEPKPIALTQRGMQEQVKHVIRRSQPLPQARKGIEALMGVERTRPNRQL